MVNGIPSAITNKVGVKGEWFNKKTGYWEVEVVEYGKTNHYSRKKHVITKKKWRLYILKRNVSNVPFFYS